MGSAKRSLGYPSRTAAVFALRGQGLSTAEIAERIGIETKTVGALEASGARSRAVAAAPAAHHGRLVLLRPSLLSRLRRPAERRGIHPNQLARLIVEAVVDGGLIDAVLDDADEVAERADG